MQDNSSYWDQRWREAVRRFSHGDAAEKNTLDFWKDRAVSFDRATKLSPPDQALLATVLKSIDSNTTVIDIGAGTGAWTIPLAKVAYRVTAVDPSPAMLDVLKSNLKAERITNVGIVQAQWEEAEVSNHDVTLCSHSMYSVPDLAAFVNKVNEKTLKRAFMILRLKSRNGVLADLWQKYYNTPKPEEPSFILAYNLLYAMGIYGDVEIDPHPGFRKDETIDDAVNFVRSALQLEIRPGLLEELRQYLEGVLTYSFGAYQWPEKTQNALISWTPPGRAYHN